LLSDGIELMMTGNDGYHGETVLLTGGCGYIGSHACVELFAAGYRPVVLDNLSNSSLASLDRIGRITGASVPFELGDIRDRRFVEAVLRRYDCAAVMHFAGMKAVGESVSDPLSYYDCNVNGTGQLLAAMRDVGLKRLVFSSSATVYGEPRALPINEQHPLSATNPYGRTKLVIEGMLRDLHSSDEDWRICILRYFNPAGAHESGLLGEAPTGVPNNLVPYVSQVAAGVREKLRIWGGDYPTPDGTGVRDYIHVMDLVVGHVRALARLEDMDCTAINLGVGQGFSVMDVVRAFESASGRPIPHEVFERRPGDVASCYADASLAADLLGWEAVRSIDDICRDAWRWQEHCSHGEAQSGFP
jgi:UDP-glucose 4-epimerase